VKIHRMVAKEAMCRRRRVAYAALGVAVGVSAFVAVLTVAHAGEDKLPPIMGITDGATDQIGVYQIHPPGYGGWVLDDGNGYWNADGDVVHYFGGPDTVPVVGDWDGDGVDQIGVYQIHDPGYGVWVLDDGNGYWNADGDVVYYFGGPDTVPVVGDWDGTPIPNPCQADFFAEPTDCYGPTWVQFYDLSTGEITAWEWDLDGDDITDSTEQSPAHYYNTNGFYTVALTVTGPGCENTLTWPSYIYVTGCST